MEHRMPLARYFLYVGAVLAGLLLVLDAWLPKSTLMERAHANLPVIRIRSIEKLPERVVFDTSVQTTTSAVANMEVGVQPLAMIADAPIGLSERAAFAQLQSADAGQVQRREPAIRERKPQPQRKFARKGMSRVAMARPSQFGWFGKSFW
jgi:hypothetical protein